MWHYNYSPSPDELYHYGVKGMKWKKRKKINPVDSVRRGINSGAKAIRSKAWENYYKGAAAQYLGASKAGRTLGKGIKNVNSVAYDVADKVEQRSRSKKRKIFDRVMKTELSPSGFRSAKQDIDKIRGKKRKKTKRKK